MKITKKDLDGFYSAKKSTMKCIYCGNEDWSIPSDVDIAEADYDDGDLAPQVLFPSVYNLDGSRTEEGLQILPLSCTNCGNVRMQSVSRLLDWIKERDA